MRGDIHNPEDWNRYAIQDLRRAEKRLSDDPEDALFHLQQAVEKAMKGHLVGKGWKLEKIHDLEALLHHVIQRGTDVSWFQSAAAKLTIEYFADRYPGTHEPELKAEESAELLKAALRLFEQLGVRK